MSKFEYVLPSGAEFVVNGPPEATRAQADLIFYQQVAAGSLVGYTAGQTLTSPASKITKFELSRLDRGTAGVDTYPILAISQGLPSVAGTPNNEIILSAIQNLPLPTRMPNLAQTPITDPVDLADLILVKGDTLGPDTVGPLSAFQIQKLLAQIKNLVDQDFREISQEKGIGQYGFSCIALEQAGYVKPGTSARYINDDPAKFVAVMNSPSVWTGKDGIYSLADLLDSADTQSSIQNQLMRQGYDDLVAAGIIKVPTRPSISVSSGQVYVAGGLQSVRNLALLGGNLGALSGLVQNSLNGQTNLGTLLSSQITNLSTIGSGAVNNLLGSGAASLANLNFTSVTGLTNQIKGDIGALVMNAGKFGSQATALWANTSLSSISGSLTNGLNSLTGGFQNLATSGLNNITSSFNGIASNLTNLVPGSLSNLTSSLDVFGKAGQFATNFANPLSSLTNLSSLGNLGNLGNLANLGNLGNLGNLANLGNLGNLGNLANLGNLGSLTGALGNLGNLGSLTGALGNLGSFANIGALGDVFGGGGDLVSGTQVAGGFNNTVNRQTVDAAFARIVGSGKVPLPIYEYPSLPSLAQRLDISQAQNFLKNIQLPSGGVFGQTVTV